MQASPPQRADPHPHSRSACELTQDERIERPFLLEQEPAPIHPMTAPQRLHLVHAQQAEPLAAQARGVQLDAPVAAPGATPALHDLAPHSIGRHHLRRLHKSVQRHPAGWRAVGGIWGSVGHAADVNI